MPQGIQQGLLGMHGMMPNHSYRLVRARTTYVDLVHSIIIEKMMMVDHQDSLISQSVFFILMMIGCSKACWPVAMQAPPPAPPRPTITTTTITTGRIERIYYNITTTYVWREDETNGSHPWAS